MNSLLDMLLKGIVLNFGNHVVAGVTAIYAGRYS